MASVPEQTSIICTNCDKMIPAANMELHELHCYRPLEECESCGELIRRRNSEKGNSSNSHDPDVRRNQMEGCHCCRRGSNATPKRKGTPRKEIGHAESQRRLLFAVAGIFVLSGVSLLKKNA
ncbi:hypothetical protein Tsubulata_009250 [Turnera subulata]|uniref:TRAF-type domain-containing protein n=1 Tax=Turnera subulata TaxID=218843 RepID=A0A9Q0FZ57_9ROSI|nr:hypothetical protein Tsubulata_009250 [Turnera subulata]